MRTTQRTKLRVTGVGLALGAVAVLFAACGGAARPGVANVGSTTMSTLASPSENSGDTAAQTKAGLRFVTCMRTHGVPNMPDPLPAGGFSRNALSAAEGISVSADETSASSQFKAALRACQSTAVAYGFVHTPAQNAKHLAQETAEDACIRKHGVPNWPDPNAQGMQTFPQGITPSTPQFEKAQKVCAYLNP